MKLILFLLIFVYLQAQEQIILTSQEKVWIDKHPVIKYSAMQWKPLVITSGNKTKGALVDYLQLISQKTGLKFHYIPSKTQDELFDKFKKHEIDIILGIVNIEQNSNLGYVSDILESYPLVAVTTKKYRYVDDLDEFNGKKLLVQKELKNCKLCQQNYAKIEFLPSDNIYNGFLKVKENEAEAFIGHLATVLYAMNKYNIDGLVLSDLDNIMFDHRILMHDETLMLHNIINKAIAAITLKEHETINKKWIKYRKKENYNKVYIQIVSVLLLIVIFLLYKHREKKKRIVEISFFNERIEMALQASGSGIWDWNIITDEVYFSPVWKSLIGYEDDEIANKFEEWSSRVHPDDLPLVMNQVQACLKNKEKRFHNRHRMKHKDGHWVWIEDKGQAFYNQDGEAIRMSGSHTDVTEQKMMEERLKRQQEILYYQSHYDSLTHLPNRLLLEERVAQSLENAKRLESKIALLFIDLDHFKEINDSLGHKVGDLILQKVSKRMLSVLRSTDTVSRLGGDEFVILLDNLQKGVDASILAQKILTTFEKPISYNGKNLYLSCSIGIALFPDDGENMDDLLKFSDTAMYQAKADGRNNFAFYNSSLTEIAYERVFMVSSMKNGLNNGEFVVYYQPQYDAVKNQLVGMEALVRWEHPELGLIPPGKFIPIAESSGFIVDLDRFVMKTAMKQFSEWYKQGYSPGKISMNLAAKQLNKEDFIIFLEELLYEYNCSSECVVLEVVESQLIDNPEKAKYNLEKLTALGVKIAIDDFGTGYSSLAYLKKFPISKLKIDKSFIQELPKNQEDVVIVKAIIALAKSLGLRLIAEGAETQEQVDFLLKYGCSIIQGYYYSKPIKKEDMERILQNKG